MAKHYLLPCVCGHKLEVDATQAGLSIPCSCGLAVSVPTLRGLTLLEPAVEQPTRPDRNWGPAHGATFLAALVCLLALGAAGFAWRVTHVLQVDTAWVEEGDIREIINGMTPLQVMDEWRKLRVGLDQKPAEVIEQVGDLRQVSQSWLYVALAVAALSGIAALAGIYLLKAPARPAGRPAPKSLANR